MCYFENKVVIDNEILLDKKQKILIVNSNKSSTFEEDGAKYKYTRSLMSREIV